MHGIDVRVVDPTGNEVETGQTASWSRAARISCAVIGTIRARRGVHSGTASFAPAMLVIRTQTDTSTFSIFEGHDRHRGEKRLLRRSRSRDLHASSRARSGGFRNTRSEMGRNRKAVVVLKPGKTLTAEELIAYCRRSLANFKVPRSIEFSEPNYRRAVPAKSSREFCVTLPGPARNGRRPDPLYIMEHTGRLVNETRLDFRRSGGGSPKILAIFEMCALKP